VGRAVAEGATAVPNCRSAASPWGPSAPDRVHRRRSLTRRSGIPQLLMRWRSQPRWFQLGRPRLLRPPQHWPVPHDRRTRRHRRSLQAAGLLHDRSRHVIGGRGRQIEVDAVLARLLLGDRQKVDLEPGAVVGHQSDRAADVVTRLPAQGAGPEACEAERVVRIDAHGDELRRHCHDHRAEPATAPSWPKRSVGPRVIRRPRLAPSRRSWGGPTLSLTAMMLQACRT
jgi:hypothetical protein